MFDNDFCAGSDGLIELTNGGMIDNIEARSGLDIESFAVREGCKLIMYTSKLTILLRMTMTFNFDICIQFVRV